VMSEGKWGVMRGWGKVELDLQVRKNGAATGFSFGLVAGVTGSIKLPSSKRGSREYYVMPEINWESGTFAQYGDSGAAVVSRVGDLVAFVVARWELDDMKVAVDPATKYLDIKSMKLHRDEDDGTINYDKVWFEAASRVQITLVMDSEVPDSRSGIKSMGQLVLDM
jgi:hypothetical protein